jgi:hypothetical protein
MHHLAARASARYVDSGRMPEMLLPAGATFHLFISHSWDNQDTAANIKRQLQLLLPAVRCWLDIDDLQHISELEACVGRSASLLVLLSSPKYFASHNCLRELRAAVTAGKPLLRVHDGDVSKRGAPIAELRATCPAELGRYMPTTPHALSLSPLRAMAVPPSVGMPPRTRPLPTHPVV